ncbi:MAG: condensation domain-containing protein, partial [Limisphaerales bacterium]
MSSQRGPFPLSFAQESLWFIDQFEPNSSLYNIPHALKLKGSLDITALSKAVNFVVARHDSLRTRFIARDGKPMQEVCPHIKVPLSFSDLRGFPHPERAVRVRRQIDSESVRPFDLQSGLLLRAGLLQLADDEFVFMVTMHHIVSDLWS